MKKKKKEKEKKRKLLQSDGHGVEKGCQMMMQEVLQRQMKVTDEIGETIPAGFSQMEKSLGPPFFSANEKKKENGKRENEAKSELEQ